MCAVIGALLYDLTTPQSMLRASEILSHIYVSSFERGRDGRGFVSINGKDAPVVFKEIERVEEIDNTKAPILFPARSQHVAVVGNLRAEPTTEYVADKSKEDQQPYSEDGWHIVHNGTIANDKELRTGDLDTTIDSAAIVERLALSRAVQGGGSLRHTFWHFRKTIQELKGSFAILAIHDSEPDHMMIAANYRPIWFIHTEVGVFFASARHYFPFGYAPQMIEPYTVSSFTIASDGHLTMSTLPLWEQAEPRRALVVCSGGLDSVVAATVAQRRLGYDITLLHFRYGSRAEGPEVSAIWKVAKELGVGLWIRYLDIYEPSDSPLLQADSKIAGGEEGAEFAHEWVPARNLVMLAHATAMAEAKGFDTIILGNNLEEAGAYPDNEPEFIAKFNDLLPFAVADGKRVRVEMPVGNLMKHEIVALGHAVGAPLAHTWSCYRNGEKHCGTCGPCYMRRTAFKINKLEEVIEYVAG